MVQITILGGPADSADAQLERFCVGAYPTWEGMTHFWTDNLNEAETLLRTHDFRMVVLRPDECGGRGDALTASAEPNETRAAGPTPTALQPAN